MKHNLTKYGLFGMILVLLILKGCQKDDFYNEATTTASLEGFKVTQLKMDDLKSKPMALKKLKELQSGSSNPSHRTPRMYGMNVDTEDITMIEKDGRHSLTFRVLSEEGNGNIVDNLVLSEKGDDSYAAYILEYKLTEEEQELILQGNTLLEKTPSLITEIDDQAQPLGVYENSTESDCVETHAYEVLMCYNSQGNIVLATGNNDSICKGLSFTHTTVLLTINMDCLAGVGGGGGSGVPGPPGGGTPPGGGGGGSGNPPVITTPKVTTPKKTPCESLNNLFDPIDPQNRDLNHYIGLLAEKHNNGQENEVSYSFNKTTQYDGDLEEDVTILGEPAYREGTPTEASILYGGYYYASIHLHPKSQREAAGIFSFLDLKTLRDAYDGSSSNFQSNNEVTLILLAPDPKNLNNYNVYALKVKSWTALNLKVNNEENSPRWAKYIDPKKRMDAIQKELGDAYIKNKNNLEKYFLQRFGSYGISLYKLNGNDVWDELKLNSTPNGIDVDKTPCK